MRRTSLVLVSVLAACATPSRAGRAPGVVAATAVAAPVALAPGSPARSRGADPGACAAAWQRLEAAREAQARGCVDDDGCEAFGSCDAVTTGHAAGLWQLKGQAQDACAGQESDEISCAPRPPRCQQGRCVRL